MVFGFLKDKLKKAVGAFSKKVEEEVKEEPETKEEAKEEIKEEKQVVDEVKPEKKAEIKEEVEVPETEETVEELKKEEEKLKEKLEKEEKKIDEREKEEEKEDKADAKELKKEVKKPIKEEVPLTKPDEEVQEIEDIDVSKVEEEVKEQKEKLVGKEEKAEPEVKEEKQEAKEEPKKEEKVEEKEVKEEKVEETPAEKIVTESKIEEELKEPEKEEKVEKEEVKEEPVDEVKQIEEIDVDKVKEEVKEVLEEKKEVKEEKKETEEEIAPPVHPDEKKEQEEKEEKAPEIKEPEVKEEVKEKVEEKAEEKKGFFGKLFGKKEEVEAKEAPAEAKEVKEEKEEEIKEPEAKEEGGFSITDVFTKKKLSEDKFDDIFWELEVALLENNVAVEVIDKIRDNLKANLVDTKLKRFGVEEIISKTLKDTIGELFDYEPLNLPEKIKEKKPYVIAFVGINGVGKTTNLAKVGQYLKNQGLGCIIAAGDTFRVAAIEQLQTHADNVGIKVIRHDYGSDAAAVCFDAIEHAKANNKDVVLIDTAGRSNANVNLMDELKKVVRVANPDMKIFVGDSLTGNDAVEQAQEFDKAVGIDGIILSKTDVDDKGGAAVSISFVTKKPILFFGTGQTYDDLTPFKKDFIMNNLGLGE